MLFHDKLLEKPQKGAGIYQQVSKNLKKKEKSPI